MRSNRLDDAIALTVAVLAAAAVLTGLWILGAVAYGWPLGLAMDLIVTGAMILIGMMD